ncbi:MULTISPECIES: hypothetical protein [Dethiosulfovibrio]|uniref:Uncharacterized protein n=2 Tax=Dethiosulfovibrio TaxID=47054 RepID=A0ABS9EQD3_9BACT|nr:MULTISPECIES: hypothetical protein [Dethiosulfovibrio]MCF4114956.1 hypothetical protein [Dethiosulfovibrio russensis]MCF4143398.1 hypothetical protein [Dethiosulfovibrio marinus]MCF4145996.1 hypothetical protein [Dethiosulfovibrio acidaminovorans]
MSFEHAEIHGVQIRDMVSLTGEGDPVYRGDLYLDGANVGSFEEDPDGGPTGIFVDDDMTEKLRERMDRYFQGEGLSVQDDDDYDLFFIRLIEMEELLSLFRDLKERGGLCLVADYTDDEMMVYEVAEEEGLDQLILEEKLEDYDVYRDFEDFVIA